jgi:hypothetical protein
MLVGHVDIGPSPAPRGGSMVGAAMTGGLRSQIANELLQI